MNDNYIKYKKFHSLKTVFTFLTIIYLILSVIYLIYCCFRTGGVGSIGLILDWLFGAVVLAGLDYIGKILLDIFVQVHLNGINMPNWNNIPNVSNTPNGSNIPNNVNSGYNPKPMPSKPSRAGYPMQSTPNMGSGNNSLKPAGSMMNQPGAGHNVLKPISSSAGIVVCRKCGKKNTKGDMFCGNCGNKLM